MNTIHPQRIGAVSLISDGMAPIPYVESCWRLVRIRLGVEGGVLKTPVVSTVSGRGGRSKGSCRCLATPTHVPSDTLSNKVILAVHT